MKENRNMKGDKIDNGSSGSTGDRGLGKYVEKQSELKGVSQKN